MKIRVISAAVALIIFIPLIWLGGYPFKIACGILSILAYNEILNLKKSHKDIPNVIKGLGLISVLYLVLGNFGKDIISNAQILLPIFLLLLPTIFYKKEKYDTATAFYLIASSLLVGLFFNL